MPCVSTVVAAKDSGCSSRPQSRGQVNALSTDPAVKPSIQFNYLSCEEDMVEWRRAIRLSREIMRMPSMDAYRGKRTVVVIDSLLPFLVLSLPFSVSLKRCLMFTAVSVCFCCLSAP